MSVVVIATAKVLPGHQEAVIAVFEQITPRVRAEDGCEAYALHESDDGVVLIERWSSRETFGLHARADTVVELKAGLEGRLDGRLDVRVLRPRAEVDSRSGA